MAQSEDEYISNKATLVFFHIPHQFFFQGVGNYKNGGKMCEMGKNLGHIKNAVKLKILRA